MNILPHERGQVYLFASGKFGLQRKRIRDDVDFHIGETDDALHADPDGDPAGCKKPAFAHPHVERIRQWGDRRGTCLVEIQAGRIFLPLQVESVPLGDLANMNFH